MRTIIIIALFCITACGDQYVFVRDGKVASAPRDLPSCGVRLDSGETILGLHARGDDVAAACGWYRVVPAAMKAADGKVVTGRGYTVGKTTVQEVVTLGERKTRSPEQRISAALDAMPGATDDERVTALVRVVANVITGRLDKAVSITIPARKDAVRK